MARSRNIKPGFFTNDELGELPPLARLLFAGLWCHADREGRMKYRPKKLKAEILPYDDCDVAGLVRCLHGARMVQLYVVDGIEYLQCINFKKHQHPHVAEPQSEIPAPTETIQAPDKNGAKTSDSLNPLTDCCNPITDSLIPSTPIAESDKSLPASSPAKPDLGAVNGDAVIYIPLVGKDEWGVSKAFAAELADLYPAVDVPQTLREIRGWNLANPKSRKTAAGIRRHINQWCQKEQNRG